MSSLHWEGACGLREQSKSHIRGFIGFLCKPRNISLFFSPLFSLSPMPSILRVSLDPARAGPWQFPTLCNPMDYTYTVRGILQGRILEWVAFPFSGDLPNPGIEPRSLALQAILYQLSHKGTRILEWVAYPFSRGSSCPRNRTGVSCIAGGFSTNWAMREVHINHVLFYSIWLKRTLQEYFKSMFLNTKSIKWIMNITITAYRRVMEQIHRWVKTLWITEINLVLIQIRIL